MYNISISGILMYTCVNIYTYNYIYIHIHVYIYIYNQDGYGLCVALKGLLFERRREVLERDQDLRLPIVQDDGGENHANYHAMQIS